jgi:hypothetical protein
MAIIRKTLPALPVFTAETGPLDYTMPAFCWSENPALSAEEISAYIGGEHPATFGTLWATHFRLGDRAWAVVQRTALFPLAAEAAPLESLGLDPTQRYAAFDFWEARYLGTMQGSLPLRALPVGGSQLCAVTPIAGNAPVLIGSDRHVSMDSVSVIDHQRDGAALTLVLHGVAGETFRYWAYTPVPCAVEADVPVTAQRTEEVTCVTVRFEKATATVRLRLATK